MRKVLALSAVLLCAVLVAILFPAPACGPSEGAYEALLRANLHTIRDVSHLDRGRYPKSLADLIDAGYPRRIPIDPFTKSSETWRLLYESRPETDCTRGIVDVHSGARRKARNGRPLTIL